jgi:hypothetical protein
VTVDDKLAALANRCITPPPGASGVCGACCFTRRITTRIAATPLGGASASTDGHVESTWAVCAYRQRLVEPLLDLHEVSNPGLRAPLVAETEGEQVRRAFAGAPAEERRAFETLIETLYEQHLRTPV